MARFDLERFFLRGIPLNLLFCISKLNSSRKNVLVQNIITNYVMDVHKIPSVITQFIYKRYYHNKTVELLN